MSYLDKIEKLVSNEVVSRLGTTETQLKHYQETLRKVSNKNQIYSEVMDDICNALDIKTSASMASDDALKQLSKIIISEFKSGSTVKRKVLSISYQEEDHHSQVHVDKKSTEFVDVAVYTHHPCGDDEPFMEHIVEPGDGDEYDVSSLVAGILDSRSNIELLPGEYSEHVDSITYDEVVKYINSEYVENDDVTIDQFAELIYNMCGGGRMSGASIEWIWV